MGVSVHKSTKRSMIHSASGGLPLPTARLALGLEYGPCFARSPLYILCIALSHDCLLIFFLKHIMHFVFFLNTS